MCLDPDRRAIGGKWPFWAQVRGATVRANDAAARAEAPEGTKARSERRLCGHPSVSRGPIDSGWRRSSSTGQRCGTEQPKMTPSDSRLLAPVRPWRFSWLAASVSDSSCSRCVSIPFSGWSNDRLSRSLEFKPTLKRRMGVPIYCWHPSCAAFSRLQVTAASRMNADGLLDAPLPEVEAMPAQRPFAGSLRACCLRCTIEVRGESGSSYTKPPGHRVHGRAGTVDWDRSEVSPARRSTSSRAQACSTPQCIHHLPLHAHEETRQ